MRKVHVLAFGEDAPSTAFRWKALSQYLADSGWELSLRPYSKRMDFAALTAVDVVVLQKRIISRAELRQIRRVSRRLVYDADDRIWMRPGRSYRGWTAWKLKHRLKAICRSADVCLAANEVIASDLRSSGGKVEVLPMGIDGDCWHPRALDIEGHTVGWTGGPKNLHFLEEKLPSLTATVRQQEGWKMVVHCGSKPSFGHPGVQWEPFQPGYEPEVVRRFDIGLCPLPEDPFVEGKSPIKILQYWASGVAVVASPVGAVTEWIRDGENGLYARTEKDWGEAVGMLITDSGLRRKLALAGSSEIESRYSLQQVSQALVRQLNRLCR